MKPFAIQKAIRKGREIMDYKIIDTAKYKALLANIRDLGSVAVAFSGGVDSSFLAYVAYEALGDKAIAITLDSPYIPRWELQEARELAASIGIQHRIIRVEQIPETIVNNPSDRCYLCKKIIFKSIIDTAKQMASSENC